MRFFFMVNIIKFEELLEADLIPGNIYQGGQAGNVGDDPFNKLLGTGNSGGIRSKINKAKDRQAFMVIIADKHNKSDYSDSYDSETQILTYAGDQRESGKAYLETKQKGNQKLEKLYQNVYNFSYDSEDDSLFPVFYFQKIAKKGRNYRYIGLAFPYVKGQDLSSVCSEVKYQNNKNEEINNLMFQFTIDTESVIQREWLKELVSETEIALHAPASWEEFIKTRKFQPGTKQAIEQLLEEIVEYNLSLPTEVVEVITKGRRGQEKLRDLLLKKEHGCKICGLTICKMLIASHIIPWSEAEYQEVLDEFGSNTRGDVNNVLLLCANHDKMFDNYLISFNEMNKICASNQFSMEELEVLNIDTTKVYIFNEKQRHYLSHHWKKFKRQNINK